LNALDRDETLLFVVLRPVDSELILLTSVLRPVESDVIPLEADVDSDVA
jgi:hypothetical protein